MKEEFVTISFKSITEKDVNFLYEVYRESRIDEMGIRDWEENEREGFLKKQFEMQHKYYMENYKNARFELILFNGVSIGRLYVDRRENDIRIIEIALLKEYRGKGIGTLILRELIRESEEKQVSISLHVEYYNFAKLWYEKLGFRQEGESGVYIFMKRAV